MKKVMFSTVLAITFIGCSKDDGPTKKCESCTSDLGNKFELCDKGDGNYEYKEGGNTLIISKEAFGNASLKEVVQGFCDSDLPL